MTRSLEVLTSELNAIAQRLGLPGRGVANSAGPSTSHLPGVKAPWPAPSAALLRQALDAMPNDRGDFDDRAAFIGLAHAVKGAAQAGGFEAEGREAFLKWAATWNGPSNPAHDAQAWDGITHPAAGWGHVMRTLERVNPAGAQDVKAAAAAEAFSREAAVNRAALSGTALVPVAPFVPGQLPPRPWLFGRSVIAGFISLLVAPGGAGKSALVMTEAVAMATGRELLPGEKPIRPLTIWLHNGEDGIDEMQRRLAATMLRHGVTHAELGGRLFMSSGRTVPLRLARMGRDGPEIVPGVVDGLVEAIRQRLVDVLVLDPLGAMHGLPENANEAANLLLGALREIAERSGAAIVLLHHTSKAAAGDMDAAGAGAARGASALVDGARVVRQLVRMTPGEAGRLGVAEADRRGFLRVEQGKANLSRAEDARWIELVNVPLGNGTVDYPNGDHIGVAVAWTPPVQTGTAGDLALVQQAIATAAHPPRLDARSPHWAGWLVASALGLDAGGPDIPGKARTAGQAAAFARAKALLTDWLRGGWLIERREVDPVSRKSVTVVGIGKPALMGEADANPAGAP